MNTPLNHSRDVSRDLAPGPRGRVAPWFACGAAALLALASFAGTSTTEVSGVGVIETSGPGPIASPQKFVAIDVMLDSGESPLGAYQMTLVATSPDVRLVGVEGGEHEAFAQAPFYDPAALQRDHVILAAYSMANDLPRGLTRVARLHIACDETTDPLFTLTIDAAADGAAIALPAEAIHASTSALKATPEGGGPGSSESTPANIDPSNEHTLDNPDKPNPEGINP